MIPELKILVASPGDVIEERERAAHVIKKLQQELAGRVKLKPVLWEHNPVHAGETFQEQILHPADAHIVVAILWKRLGSALPAPFGDARGRPRTGTEYEYEEAIQAFQRTGSPEVWVYRSKRPIELSPDLQEQKEERDQLEMLDRFWKKWIEAKKKGHKWFPDAATFQEMLETDIRATVDQLVEKLQQSAPYREKLAAMAREWKERRQRPDLLLPPGQMLKDAEEIRRSFGGELDPITDAFIRESLLAKSHRGRRRALLLLFLVLGLAVLFLYLMVDSRIAKHHALASKELTEDIKSNMRDLLDGMGRAEVSPDHSWKQTKKIEKDLPICQKGYQAYAKLKKQIDKESLDLWGSRFLDNYGRLLVRVGDFKGAEGPFREALQIDEHRLDKNREDDERHLYLFISRMRMVGVRFGQMKTMASPEYRQARLDLKETVDLFKDLAGKAQDEGTKKKRTDRLANAERLLKEFEVTQFLPFPKGQAEFITEGTLTDGDLIFYLRLKEKGEYVPKCKVYAVELEGGKTYEIRLEAEKKNGKPTFDTFLLLQNGIFEKVAENDDFGGGTDSQITIPVRRTGTYRLFVASAPQPVPNLPPTGKFFLKIKVSDGPG